MCQAEIIEYLRGQNHPVDMQELTINLPANRASISVGCKKLRERMEIKFVKKKIKSYEKFLYFL